MKRWKNNQASGKMKGYHQMKTNASIVEIILAAAVLALGLAPSHAQTGPNPAVNYSKANYANSPALRKFVDSLPGLGPSATNNLGQYIPVAFADTNTYPGCDYYQIGLSDYKQKMHSDLPPTRLRGYRDLSPAADGTNHYLGPFIIAQRDRAVRIKFYDRLPTGTNGNLFLPVDTTVMGAGMGPQPASRNMPMSLYTQNRAVIHLHGGFTPWISDGTPHQWITPSGENTPYTNGVSQRNVPDMPNPGRGAATYYYPNQQSARLMFIHDHTYGMTRLNVYAGEAAGYLLTDPVEQGLVSAGIIPSEQIPLIIQDKTFVPDAATLAATDPLWQTNLWGGYGSLWFPHVYMPNQDPNSFDGANPMGRWDYGPWFWPPQLSGTTPGDLMHTTPPTLSIVPEAFMDTPMVNGTAYPYLKLQPKAYRFRILNICNDRTLNLQLYYVDPAHPTEVKMVAAVPHPASDTSWPATWPTDGRDGGVPDPLTVGPPLIQIGTEGGMLPAPVVIPSTPINYIYNRRDIVVLNISTHALLLGPAERADVIVDFSQVPPGSKLILYNDAPAPVPAFDPRYDYYTGNPDQTDGGGAPTTPEGYGPNTRTIMQFQVNGTPAAPFDLAALNHSFPAAYAASQPGPVVPEVAYGAATNTYSTIFNNSLTFTPMGSAKAVTINFQPKAIQELFDPYGRMNATLGVEIPRTTLTTQTTIPYGYIDPPTETISMGTPQIWKITHNGVDTHAIHFHLFNVQVINRVGWDGMVKPPDPNELGWKETVRMNPLEDVIVVFRPEAPWLPFSITNSVRPLDPTSRIGSTAGFMDVDPSGNPVTVQNVMTDFGWEYAWHCHLLGHEENDMMRPIVMTGVKDYVKPVQIPPTWWLQQYYGNQRRPTNLASVYIAGLNPTNPASVLKFVSATLQPDRQEIKVVFGPTVANRVYTLYGASSLMGPWTSIYARVAGYPDAMDLIVPTSSQMSFFRLSVNLP
jgi:FtsP/CotA-like multicopper oxidase with cupredoxin domain